MNMYSQVFTEQAHLLKAIAEPKRLELINLLRYGKLTVSKMQLMLGLTQANISQHLKVLREASLVNTKRRGKEIEYSLKHKEIVKACDLIRHLIIKDHPDELMAVKMTMSMDKLIPIVKDPICGMRFSAKTAAFRKRDGDKTYYFCGEGCLKAYEQKND